MSKVSIRHFKQVLNKLFWILNFPIWNDPSSNFFPVEIIFYTDHLYIAHPFPFVKECLNLKRGNVLPSSDYHIFRTTHYTKITIFINFSNITTMNPAVSESFCCLFRVFPVLLHGEVTSYANLPLLSNRHYVAPFINKFNFSHRTAVTHCCRLFRERSA